MLSLIFTPQTPNIIGMQSKISVRVKFSLRISIPAKRETTVIIFENDAERITLILLVE